MSAGVRLLYRRGFPVTPAPHELLVEWYTLAAQGALRGTVSGKVPADQAEHRPTAEIHGGTAPQATDADDLRSELVHQLDQQIQGAAGRHEVLDEEDLGPGT